MRLISLSADLVKKLEEYITKELRPNDKIPSERALSKQYQVSRNTVRIALNQLFLRGDIYRSPGKGTFVADRMSGRTDVASSISFTKQMGAMNLNPKSRIEELKQIAVPEKIAKHLRLDPGAPVFVLVRLRIANDEPMMFERTYLPADLLPGFSKKLLGTTPLYDLLDKHYGIHIATVDETFFADLMGDEYAKALNVATGSACLKIRRTTFTDSDRIIEYTKSVARADRFIYQVHHANH
ncbi:GntR family transcriptional regulator [Lacticaseibacillus camelliae]|uniref:GntR family transcriptional regulator n=1 Tax=Lacticaseibacillus camelliae DSM 22697 = JCM 13995 TaxID=1423730 RepID=A0A0R2FD50_9LACO|nr:GntR family transcriptional regulator [Lacticaseibacillus camelliae]KRN25211.1 GntR family transcriptional regulator [Lacticaseibacillus camelliae DSM 22697 = JCM 13995]